MKKVVFIAILLMGNVMFSCGNNQTSANKKDNDVKSEKNTKVPDGWAEGKGEEFVPKTKPEQNLVAQHDTYQRALFLGNIEEMKHFFYKESLEYYKQYFPGRSLDDILDEFLKDMSGDAMRAIREYEDNGVEFAIYIQDIVRRVEYGNDLLYVYNVACRLEGYKDDTLLYLHTKNPDLTLGVSHNKGKNCTFIAMTNEVPSILRMYYPQSVINEVMGY